MWCGFLYGYVLCCTYVYFVWLCIQFCVRAILDVSIVMLFFCMVYIAVYWWCSR